MRKFWWILILVLLFGGIFWLAIYEKRDKDFFNQETEEKTIRQSAVAGQFYSSDKKELTQMIGQFLNEVNLPEREEQIRALIVPHASHAYSGGVAAHGFKVIQGQEIKRIILIGSSHNFYLDKAVIDSHDVWQTVLGQVSLDTDLRDKLVKESSLFQVDSEPHKTEHSLEVEIPFLQTVLSDFKLLPILVNHQLSQNDLDEISQILTKYVDDYTLIIASSDLSHYPPYQQAIYADGQINQAILTGQVDSLEEVISQLEKEKITDLDTYLCSRAAVEVVMKVAKNIGADQINLLKYANSGDLSFGDPLRVVGYSAISFSGNLNNKLNQEQKKTLLSIARQSVEDYVSKKQLSRFSFDDPGLNEHLGAFVTLEKRGQLRGCIGSFEPNLPLYQVVSQMAISAAVNDSRFQPVRVDELDDLEYEISVLSPLRKVDSWQEIELGKHGVQIKQGIRSGVFLPQVARDNDWDLDEFMGQLCSQKAGLDWECWKDNDLDIYVFTATIFGEE